MTLYSPLEDFVQRTLSHFSTAWQKLEYVASLKRDEGRYEHWGLARVFGEMPAQKAIEQAHRNLVLQILRTPLTVLVAEAKTTADGQNVSVEAYVVGLYERVERLLPTHLGGGSARHFSSVLLAVSSLVVYRHERVATRQVS